VLECMDFALVWLYRLPTPCRNTPCTDIERTTLLLLANAWLLDPLTT
jgi:hypothetical protein